MQDYEKQLDALNELRRFLLQLKDDLKEQTITYKTKIESLRDIGLPIQVLDNYLVNYYNPNHLGLHKLIESIENADLPYINSLIAHTEQALELARRMG